MFITFAGQVLSTKPSRFIGDTSYGVELIDTTTEVDVKVSEILISRKLAIPKRLNVLVSLIHVQESVKMLLLSIQNQNV